MRLWIGLSVLCPWIRLAMAAPLFVARRQGTGQNYQFPRVLGAGKKQLFEYINVYFVEPSSLSSCVYMTSWTGAKSHQRQNYASRYTVEAIDLSFRSRVGLYYASKRNTSRYRSSLKDVNWRRNIIWSMFLLTLCGCWIELREVFAKNILNKLWTWCWRFLRGIVECSKLVLHEILLYASQFSRRFRADNWWVIRIIGVRFGDLKAHELQDYGAHKDWHTSVV